MTDQNEGISSMVERWQLLVVVSISKRFRGFSASMCVSYRRLPANNLQGV